MRKICLLTSVITVLLFFSGCGKFYYAKDFKFGENTEFKWLKDMEEYVFNKKTDRDRTPGERTFYLASFFDAEMQRSGFSSYFQNVASKFQGETGVDLEIRDTVAALNALELGSRAEMLEEAYARYKQLNADPADKGEAAELIEEYSNKYFRLSANDKYYLEGLIVKLHAFVKKNIDDFFVGH